MFKSLKDKLGESLAGTPARSLLPTGQQKQGSRSGASNNSTPSGSSTLDAPDLGHGDFPGPLASRSRTSSISSQASDLSFASPASVPFPGGNLDLDGSFSEVETDSTSATSMSKDELYQMYCKVQRQARQYKSGYLQVMTVYKELERERDKLKNTLVQSQDKSLKAISDLKEQLKRRAADSDELVNVLQMQISCLKEGKPIPDELTSKSEQLLKSSLSSNLPADPTSASIDANSNVNLDASQLREKVKRQETLLIKCQETMKANKEKIQQLSADRESACQQLDIKSEELDKCKDEREEAITRFQNQLRDARKLIEDLESDKALTLATMKQQFHETLEGKDAELMELKRKVHGHDNDTSDLKEEIQRLNKTVEEQREKSREIIKRLKAEKSRLEEEAQAKIEKSEHELEKEKDSELQELRRGKVEALQVLQQQMEEKMREQEKEKEAALEERDRQWEEKLRQREQAKLKEFEAVLAEKQEEMTLAIEEQELQKVAAVKQCDHAASDLQLQCDSLAQDKKELEIKFESVQNELSSLIASQKEELRKVREENSLAAQEVQSMHDAELLSLRDSSKTELNEKLEEMRAEYTIQINSMTADFERRLTENQTESDTDYEKLISDLKIRHESALEDSRSIVSHLRNEVKDLSDVKEELEKKIFELSDQMSVEKRVAERYAKELDEVEARSKKERESFQGRLKGLIDRIDYQSNAMDSLMEDNRRLHTELTSMQTKSDETVAAMRKEIEELLQTTAKKFLPTDETGNDSAPAAESAPFPMGEVPTGSARSVALEELGVDELRAEVLRLESESTSQIDLHARQISSSAETVRMLERRISDLIDRENHLNVELEQSKTENERIMASHNNEMQSLRSKIDELLTSEKVLTQQLKSMDERCENEIARASMENISAMSQFSELLTESQQEMTKILQELMETKERSNEMVAALEQELHVKCLELDDAHRRIAELGGDASVLAMVSDGQTVFAEDVQDNGEQKQAIDGKINLHETSEIENHPGDDARNMDSVERHVEIAESSRGQEANHPIPDDSFTELTSDDLIQRISELENSLAEKDRKIVWFEAKVKDFGRQIQHETEEMKMRSRQVELLMADKDELLKEKDVLMKDQSLLIKDLEHKVRELESSVVKKTSDFVELEKKFWQLQGEAKSRITSLKQRLLEKDAGREVDVPEQVKQAREDFAAEMAEVREQHEADIALFKENLEKEQQNMVIFQENVKRQFEENQEKVKFMINKLRDGCEQSLMDRDRLYEIKLMNLEREKNAEKDKEVRELMATVDKLRDELQMPTDELAKKQTEEINFLKAELESFKVRHRETVLRFQGEKEALLKYAGDGGEQMLEKVTLEQRNAEEGGQGLGTTDDAVPVKATMEVELEKLSEENAALRRRIVDLEKQRDAVLEMAKEIGINKLIADADEASSKETFDELQEKAENVDQRKELEKLQNEIKELVEKNALLENQQKEVSESYEKERAETDGKHSETVQELTGLNKSKEEELAMVNERLEELKQEGTRLLEEVEELKIQNNLKNDTIDVLQKKVLRLDELDGESVKQLEEIGKLNELIKNNETTIHELNAKVTELEAREKQITEEKIELNERLKSAEDHSVRKVEEATSLLSASRLESNEAVINANKTNEELGKRVTQLQDEMCEREKAFGAEKDRIVEESREKCSTYEQRLSEMEKIDVDLQTQLKELSDKLSSVTDNAVQLEKVVAEYQKQEDDHRSTVESCRSQLADAERRLSSIREEFERLKQETDDKSAALAEAELKLGDQTQLIDRLKEEHAAALTRLNSEWQLKTSAINPEHVNSLQSVHPDDKSNPSNDLPIHAPNFGGGGDSMGGLAIEKVERKIRKVVLPVVEFVSSENSSGENGVRVWHDQEVEQLRAEHKLMIQQHEDEHNSKVLQLIKDFNVQTVEREQRITEAFRQEIEALQKTEARLLADHREQTRDLNQQVNERNERMEEIVQNCEAQIQAADERHKDHVDKLNQIIQDLQQTLVDKEHEWMTSRGTVRLTESAPVSQSDPQSSAEPTVEKVNSVQLSATSASSVDGEQVARLRVELEELRTKHSAEVGELVRRLQRYETGPLSPLLPGMDHKDSLIALGGDDVCRLLEMQNSNLETEVSRHLVEIARLRDRERELLHELEMRAAVSRSNVASAATVLGSLLMEPTEMEYLKNVLYNYMIGLETKTLAKVICTVVKFSDEQTRLILEKEDARNSIFTPTHR